MSEQENDGDPAEGTEEPENINKAILSSIQLLNENMAHFMAQPYDDEVEESEAMGVIDDDNSVVTIQNDLDKIMAKDDEVSAEIDSDVLANYSNLLDLDTEHKAPKVNEEIAGVVNKLRLHRISADQCKTMIKRHHTPENVKVRLPKCENSIWTQLPTKTRASDAKLQATQQILLASINCQLEVTNKLVNSKASKELLTPALDGLTLAMTANYEINQRRRDAIKPQFKPEFAKGLCSSTNPADEFLFGGDTSKRVKEIAEVQKSRVCRGQPGQSSFRGRNRFAPYSRGYRRGRATRPGGRSSTYTSHNYQQSDKKTTKPNNWFQTDASDSGWGIICSTDESIQSHGVWSEDQRSLHINIDSSLLGQNSQRPSRGSVSGTSLAHSNMVHQNLGNADQPPCGDGLDRAEPVASPPIRSEDSQHAISAETDGLPSIREYYKKQGFSQHVTSVLVSSWRPSTQKQYTVYIKKWTEFCSAREINPFSPHLNEVLEFLYTLIKLSYSSLNTARSALSCIVTIDKFPVGQHPVVCRFLKGAFEQKPPSLRYFAIWDVNQVLQFLKTLSPNRLLSLKELTHKLAALLALVTIQRKQTLLQLDISADYLKKSKDEYIFVLNKHVKQSRPNYPVPPVIIPRYTPDANICPLLCLEDYIERTRELRQDNVLFIATIKPYKAVGPQTMSRWIKTVLEWAGIDMSLFRPHSTRHAAATAAFNASIPLDDILKRAGWSSAKTFKRFYLKHVVNESLEC